MAEIENLKIGNGGTLHIVGNEDIVANAWQAGKTYVKNKSYVIREHSLYVCNVTHTSVEPFDTTKWTEITIGDAIGNNIGDLSQLTTTDKSSLVGSVNEVNSNTTPTFSSFSGTSAVKDIEYMQVCKIGKICIVSAKFTINGAITGGVKSLFTGLPKATNNRWIFPASVLTGTDKSKTRRLSVNSSGGIDAYYDNFYDNNQVYFHSVYVSTT